MANLRYRIKERLQVTCFGIFNVFFEDTEVKFRREKEQELLAFLIANRGEAVSGSVICNAIWPESEENKKDYFWKILSDLRKDLSAIGFDDILVTAKDSYSIDTSKVDCDYYKYMDGLTKSWNGKFMEQYSLWAEEKKGQIYFLNE